MIHNRYVVTFFGNQGQAVKSLSTIANVSILDYDYVLTT